MDTYGNGQNLTFKELGFTPYRDSLFSSANDLHNLRGQLPMLKPGIAIPRQVDALVRAYFIASIPGSLHIFLARLSLISVCRGTEERLFWLGFPHQECLEPSLMN